MATFKKITPYELKQNPFTLLNKDWALLTAGPAENCNTMTVSWGGMGILWNYPVATIYVRPQRFTYGFMEENDTFTLSFFNEDCRDALKICGAKSGRDGDKIKEARLTKKTVGTAAGFEEAKLILVCKKIYFNDFQPDHFLDPKIASNYPSNDYHRMYIGKIEEVLIRE